MSFRQSDGLDDLQLLNIRERNRDHLAYLLHCRLGLVQLSLIHRRILRNYVVTFADECRQLSGRRLQCQSASLTGRISLVLLTLSMA